MKKFFQGLSATIGLLLLYLLFWPVDVDPAVWVAPEPPEMKSKFASNNYFQDVEILGVNDGIGPEDIAVDEAGNMYAGYEDGRIIKYDVFGKNMGVFVNTGGRPLGLDFDDKWNLIIADANQGLLQADLQGNLVTLALESDGIKFKFTDDVDVASDGKIYFSDASSRYAVHHYKFDLVAHRPYGRLLVYDPNTKKTTTLLSDLYFANGVAVSPNDDFILVSETSEYRIQKILVKRR